MTGLRPLWILFLLALSGCSEREPLPWTLLELGSRPIRAAWDQGEALVLTVEARAQEDGGPKAAASNWPIVIFPDTSAASRIMRRELFGLADIACGDRMRLHPQDLPPSLRAVLDEQYADSVELSWQCAHRTELAALLAPIVALSAQPGPSEERWLATLRKGFPEKVILPEHPYREGDHVQLEIEAYRPDGSLVGDTVKLAFRWGEPDQVVPALKPFLLQAGKGSSASLWSRSDQAFGTEAHPVLGLPAHTPVQFVVKAR